MICISIAETQPETIRQIIDSLQEGEMAEIRLDQMELSPREIETIFSVPNKLIATCRSGKYNDQDRMRQLKNAVASGADFIDIEVESDDSYSRELVSFCRKHNCSVIISYHNYDETPASLQLRSIIDDCFNAGAEIAKIACMTQSASDSSRILALYEDKRPLVAIGMGEFGKITRVAAPLLGAPFTFAALDKGKETAAGQMDRATMNHILKELKYGN